MDIKPYLNRNVILGTVAVAGILVVVTFILIGWTSPRFSPEVGFAPADLTMIPAPTHTPGVTPTPTPDPFATPTLSPDSVAVGAYVQITGTEGQGLRIRQAPGLNSETGSAVMKRKFSSSRTGRRPRTAMSGGILWLLMMRPAPAGPLRIFWPWFRRLKKTLTDLKQEAACEKRLLAF